MIKIGMPQLFEFDTVEENLVLAKKLGLDFIELNLNFGYCRDEMEQGKLPALLAKYGIEATLHFYDEADFGSYKEVVKAYMTLLERYASLGKGYIKQLNVHLNPGPVVTIAGEKNYIYEKEYGVYVARLLANYNQAKMICKSFGINMVIENTDNIPPFMRKVYRELYNCGFHFCFDIGHDHLSSDILWKISEKASLPFDEFHIHDAKDQKKCHLTLGEGELDIAKYKRLAEKNNAYVVLEVKQSSDLITSVPAFKNL